MTNSTKTMTRLVLVLAGLMLFVSGCSQDEVTGPDPEQTFFAEDPLDDVLKSTDGLTPVDPLERLARLAEVLGLDENQLADLTVAYLEFRDGVAALSTQVHNGEMTLEDARVAVADLREAFEAELQVILTAEQWDLLQDMRFQGQQRDGRNHHHQAPHDRWTAWLGEAGADETQVADILAALDVLHSGMQDLRAQMRDDTLTREEAREAAEILRTEFDAALQSILTVEQYEALMLLRPDCGGPRHR
jgi:hypothetical protein